MAQDDFSEFSAAMQNESDAAAAAYILPRQKKLDYFARVRMLRTVFKLTSECAHVIAINATLDSLKDQEKLPPIFDLIMRHRVQ